MSFKKILVAVDDSSATATVFAKVLELAQRDAAQLMICHSIELATSSQLTVNLVDLEGVKVAKAHFAAMRRLKIIFRLCFRKKLTSI
ncbi:universal stress protein [Nostoc sp. FACHB-892]|uniref:universal stress protein n=1 Tax=Nostoc sp. FACHB-892 TaxID=2692843 RepID=UPI001684BD0D|nr:universal stress protein [Nostoc sp. FACHB-892]MBD2731334.1 universal stress protein [Nostoc sp. FACHB-892]